MLGLSDYCQVRDVVWDEKGWGMQEDLFKGGLGAILVLLFGNASRCFPKRPSCSALRHWRAKQRKVGGKFLPATSSRATKRKSTLSREAPGGGWETAGPSLWGWGATHGGLAPVAGRGKPLPCTAPLANCAWGGPAANRRPQGRSPWPRPRGPSSVSAVRRTAAAVPTRPATSPPARPNPGPERLRAPRRLPGGVGAPSPRLTCALDPRAARRGVGCRRARLADSNFVALGTAQSSLPRGAGGAARAVTQWLARWRSGPYSRPPAPAPRTPDSARPRPGGEMAAVRRARTLLGKAWCSLGLFRAQVRPSLFSDWV